MSGYVSPIVTMHIVFKNDEIKEKYHEHIEKHNENILDEHPNAGFDILCPEKLVIEPGTTAIVNTRIHCSMDDFMIGGWNNKGQLMYNTKPISYYIYLRSSIAAKTSLRLANSVAIIDSGYRGEIILILDNISKDKVVTIEPFSRIAQICSPNLSPINVKIVNEFISKTSRGEGGLGSTGT